MGCSTPSRAAEPMSEIRIAIIGAGVGGLTFASYLSRLGLARVHITIFERRLSVDSQDGGTLLLQGEGIEVLRELGLSEKLLGAAEPELRGAVEAVSTLVDMGFDRTKARQALQYVGGNLTQAATMLAEGRESTSAEDVANSACSVYVMRDYLLKLLLSSLNGRPLMHVNCEVLDISEESGCVTVEWRPNLIAKGDCWEKNTASTTFAKETFALVVGADGNARASQAVKHVLNEGESCAKELPLLVLQAMIPVESPREKGIPPTQQEYLYQQRLRGNILVGRLDIGTAIGSCPTQTQGNLELAHWEFCTVFVHFRNAMAQFPQGPHAWAKTMMSYLASSEDAVLRTKASELVDQACQGVRGGRLHSWVPFQKDAFSKWSSPGGRIVLLGDAAHLIPPTRGWGANFALGDARALLKHLESCLRSQEFKIDDVQAQLCQYEMARQTAIEIGILESKAESDRIISGR